MHQMSYLQAWVSTPERWFLTNRQEPSSSLAKETILGYQSTLERGMAVICVSAKAMAVGTPLDHEDLYAVALINAQRSGQKLVDLQGASASGIGAGKCRETWLFPTSRALAEVRNAGLPPWVAPRFDRKFPAIPRRIPRCFTKLANHSIHVGCGHALDLHPD